MGQEAIHFNNDNEERPDPREDLGYNLPPMTQEQIRQVKEALMPSKTSEAKPAPSPSGRRDRDAARRQARSEVEALGIVKPRSDNPELQDRKAS